MQTAATSACTSGRQQAADAVAPSHRLEDAAFAVCIDPIANGNKHWFLQQRNLNLEVSNLQATPRAVYRYLANRHAAAGLQALFREVRDHFKLSEHFCLETPCGERLRPTQLVSGVPELRAGIVLTLRNTPRTARAGVALGSGNESLTHHEGSQMSAYIQHNYSARAGGL
jgi:hypothetical protein